MTQVLMIQGTLSDAGKSTLTAGLCRYLKQQGLRVAPFKPQNMALNSAVTVDGGEIGRAQAVQAQACRLDCHTDMNPILLKPQSETGAQVIINGQVYGFMNARDYHQFKPVAMEFALSAFTRLCENYDVVIIEGAGSPAEINLRENDIANMGFAEAVDCPVLLVGDIERGGVFAQLAGTLSLLSPSEQARICGLIINRFRGDVSLLTPGIEWLENHCRKPVLGVLPYLKNLHLDGEDSLNMPATQDLAAQSSLTVVVPRLPRMSNHTDLESLAAHPQVNLVITQTPQAADLILLPGSKAVVNDLIFLREHGWEKHLQQHLRYGGKLIGICGGYQMLGRSIEDPEGLESTHEYFPGLDLLNMTSELKTRKQLRTSKGWIRPLQVPVHGYEIHTGVSKGPDLENYLIEYGDKKDGCISADGQIMGSYFHGLFDHPQACAALLQWAGLDQAETVDRNALREASLDRLADEIALHLDLSMVDQLVGLNAKV